MPKKALETALIQALSSVDERWLFKRNCSLSPKHLGLMFFALALFSLMVAGFWAFVGAWFVLVFALIEVCALGLAFVLYARHAADYESIECQGEQVRFEFADGQQTHVFETSRGTLRLAYEDKRRALIEVRAQGHTVQLGRFVPESERGQFAQTLAKSLRAPLYRSRSW
jgi:uncharacterized membrane protein